ncbi:MAG: LemA family protein [Kiritimatiellia bacterium]|jgi:LemA protein|nr:LemA family protein [Kiritimatiellia bacterium]
MNARLMILIGVPALLVIWAVSLYNGLVALRNRFKNAFAQIDVQLKRRYDLIPNLVETAKGYLRHERETLEAVVQARNQAMAAAKAAAAAPADASAVRALSGAEGTLRGSLDRLMLVVEQYPDLKANQNMMQLQEEIASTENRIAFARQAYNDEVMAYNIKREIFPNSLVAALFRFDPAQLLELESPAERQAPQVRF